MTKKQKFKKPRRDLFEELKYTSMGILMNREDKSALYEVKELNNTHANFVKICEALEGDERMKLFILASVELSGEIAERMVRA